MIYLQQSAKGEKYLAPMLEYIEITPAKSLLEGSTMPPEEEDI